MEETSRKIVSLQLTGFFYCLNEGSDTLDLRVTGRVRKQFEDIDSQLKYRHVVDLIADAAPRDEQARSVLTERFSHCSDIGSGRRQAVLEGDSVEEYQATDAQGRCMIFLLVGTCDQIGDAVSDASVLIELISGLFKRVSDDGRRRRHPIHALQFQRQRTHVIGQFRNGPAMNWPFRNDGSAGAVQPPSNVCCFSKRCMGILRTPQAVWVKDAEHTNDFRISSDPVSELTFQRAGRVVPFAFGDDRVATR